MSRDREMTSRRWRLHSVTRRHRRILRRRGILGWRVYALSIMRMYFYG